MKLSVTIDCSTENLRHQSREFFEVKVQGNWNASTHLGAMMTKVTCLLFEY
jgi:hypothetical protein